MEFPKETDNLLMIIPLQILNFCFVDSFNHSLQVKRTSGNYFMFSTLLDFSGGHVGEVFTTIGKYVIVVAPHDVV